MKASHLVFLVGLVIWILPGACLATNVGTGTIEQPVNLGPNSDPARIPLGAVGTISNYGYGTHRVIGEPRPCPDGAMRWEGGTELDQNLASVFGISVEAEDPTQIRAAPVTLRVKPWKIPGYSPYTKEQVLAATLWCLIRSAGGTPESPLDVRIVAEGQEDKSLEKKYSGKYVTMPGKDEKEVPPPKVPGTVVEEDGRGIAWVVFPEVKKRPQTPAAPPAMILFERSEADTGDRMWDLLPIWGSGIEKDAPLHLNSWPASMCYSCWKSDDRGEANAFLVRKAVSYLDVEHGENGDSVEIRYPFIPQATLVAEILALVVAAQPTEKRPLTVAIRLEKHGLAGYPVFRGAPDWKEIWPDAHTTLLKCEFVWHAAERKLIKGSVPLVKLNTLGRFTVEVLPHESPSEVVAKEIATNTLRRINEGIRDSSLLAEKNMADEMLSRFGLQREIGKAGYYEALAQFCNEMKVPDKPLEDPFRSGNPELDQYHRMGWDIGMNWGQAIGKEARKFIEEANRKKGEESAK